jgi:hypothetical protein
MTPVIKRDTVRIKRDTGVSRSGYFEIAENLERSFSFFAIDLLFRSFQLGNNETDTCLSTIVLAEESH